MTTIDELFQVAPRSQRLTQGRNYRKKESAPDASANMLTNAEFGLPSVRRKYDHASTTVSNPKANHKSPRRRTEEATLRVPVHCDTDSKIQSQSFDYSFHVAYITDRMPNFDMYARRLGRILLKVWGSEDQWISQFSVIVVQRQSLYSSQT